MAGIGFELRKVFMDKTISGKIKGVSYSVLVAVGPMLISVLTLVFIRQITLFFNIPQAERQVISAALMYAFIFALINAGSLTILLSRLIADLLYVNDSKPVMQSLAESSAFVLITGLVMAFFLFFRPSLPFYTALLIFLTLALLSVIYILMVCLTALKNYRQIAFAYLSGATLSILLTILFLALSLPALPFVLLAVNLGYLLNLILMLRLIRKHFPPVALKQFVLFDKIIQMPRLVLIGFFYTAGIFSHNFIIWLYSPLREQIAGTFYTSPYDMASFYAVLTIFTATIIFIVKVETAFYEKYKQYSQSLIDGGDLHQISQNQKRMVTTLRQEIFQLFELQLIISVLVVLIGTLLILPLLKTDAFTIRLFIILSGGFYLSQMMYFIMTLLLYFDNQEDALWTSLIFLTTTTSLAILTIKAGPAWYGSGFAGGALLALIFSLNRLNHMMKNIDYRLYSKQPLRRISLKNIKTSQRLIHIHHIIRKNKNS